MGFSCDVLFVCFCACLWEELGNWDSVQSLSICADLQDFLTHKNTVGERVRHVNKHVHGCVLKLETDLCSVWDQLFKGHTEQVSSAQ